MLEISDIRRIKAAQGAAGMGEEAYRELLRERFHATSCKGLSPDDVDDCVRLIKRAGTRRDGWSAGQLGRFRRYRRLAGLGEAQARAEVQAATGRFTELAPDLTDAQFDRTMQLLEQRAEERLAAEGRPWPEGMLPRYWRSRNAGCNQRLLHKLDGLWRELVGYLPEGRRTDEYLCGIVAQATGYPCKSRYGLQTYQVLPTIEALKDRLDGARGGDAMT